MNSFVYRFFVVIIILLLISAPSYSQDTGNKSPVDSSKIINRHAPICKIVNREQIENIPLENALAVPSYFYPQVTNSNSPNYGFENKTRTLLGGSDINNVFSGTYGFSGASYYPVTSGLGIDEIQIYDSNIPVEYGESLDGLLLYKLRKGSTRRYEGFIRFYTEVPFLFGSMDDYTFRQKLPQPPATNDNNSTRKLNSTGERIWDAGFGGPLPYLSNSSFFLSAKYFRMDNEPGLKVYDPAGNNLGKMPDQGRWVKNISGRIAFDITPKIRLDLETVAGLSSIENSSWFWLYANDPGVSGIGSGVKERIAKQNAVNQSIVSFAVRLNHSLTDNTDYEIKISRNLMRQESARKADFNGPSFWSGFNLIRPEDNFRISDSAYTPGSDGIIDQYVSQSKLTTSEDGVFPMDLPQINPLTGYYEGILSTDGTNNAYGLRYFFAEHGNDQGFDFLRSSYWDFDLKLRHNMEILGAKNSFLLGIDYKNYELKRHYNNYPWDAQPVTDVFTDEGDRLSYFTDFKNDPSPARPNFISAYGEDNITIGNLVINAGIRVDHFDPHRDFIGGEKDTTSHVDPKIYFSPRINISYSFSDNFATTLSYGRFTSMPDFLRIYHFNDLLAGHRGNTLRGNPDIKPLVSEQLNLNFSGRFDDFLIISLDGFIKNNPYHNTITFVPAWPDNYFIYDVADEPATKAIGLNAGLGASFMDYFNLRINASTARLEYPHFSEPGFSGSYYFALSNTPYTLSAISSTLSLQTGNNEGIRVFGIYPLENTYAGLTGTFQTGLPYTPLDLGGRPIAEMYSKRNPDYFRFDLRLSKSFNVSELIGDASGNTEIELAFDVINLTDRTKPVRYYPTSGDPDDDGASLHRVPGNFPSISYYEKADYNNPLTFSSGQYDQYGRRRYSAAADIDKNGIVTPAESYQRYLDFVQDAIRLRPNYQTPRMVYFSVSVKF